MNKLNSLLLFLLFLTVSILTVGWTAAHILRGNIHGIGFLVAAAFIYLFILLTRSSWREFRHD